MEITFSGLRSFLRLPIFNENPDVVIAGVPFDLGTTFRPGARFGPAAIRSISNMLLDGDNPFHKINPQTELSIIDIGDFSIVNGYIEESLDLIQKQAEDINSHLVCMGGDHTITLPLLRALRKKYKNPISIVHFDAHVDTWNDSFGGKIGHGTTFHYAAQEKLIDPKRSVQIGIRSPVQNSIIEYTKNLGFHIMPSEMVHRVDLDHIIKGIKEIVGNNNVYLTFDIDCIDPSQAPGTGTPEIGGLFTWQVLSILNNLKTLNWVGMDLVEVSPPYDHSDITSLAGATIIWTYLCLLFR